MLRTWFITNRDRTFRAKSTEKSIFRPKEDEKNWSDLRDFLGINLRDKIDKRETIQDEFEVKKRIRYESIETWKKKKLRIDQM